MGPHSEHSNAPIVWGGGHRGPCSPRTPWLPPAPLWHPKPRPLCSAMEVGGPFLGSGTAGTRGGFGGQLWVVSPLLGDFGSWDARALPERPPAFTSLRGCDSLGLTRVLEAAAVAWPRCPQHPAVPPAPTPISGAGAARSTLIPAQRRFVRTGCIFILLLPPVSC